MLSERRKKGMQRRQVEGGPFLLPTVLTYRIPRLFTHSLFSLFWSWFHFLFQIFCSPWAFNQSTILLVLVNIKCSSLDCVPLCRRDCYQPEVVEIPNWTSPHQRISWPSYFLFNKVLVDSPQTLEKKLSMCSMVPCTMDYVLLDLCLLNGVFPEVKKEW